MEHDERIERGAAEEGSGAPLTETEVEAAKRPPSEPKVGDQAPSDGTDLSGSRGRAAEVAGVDQVGIDQDEVP